jgi:hypothetical protein
MSDMNNKLKIIRVGMLLLFSLGLSPPLLAQVNKQVTEQDVQSLVDKLEIQPWGGPINLILSGNQLEASFSEPMKEILKIGNPAQNILLKNLSNPKIKNEIIILLGGVGDERAIKSIINEMLPDGEYQNMTKFQIENRNEAAKIALTNITTADLASPTAIGTFYGEKCPGKTCWEKWWEDNQLTFSVKNIEKNRSRFYVPNYGIYSKPKQ